MSTAMTIDDDSLVEARLRHGFVFAGQVHWLPHRSAVPTANLKSKLTAQPRVRPSSKSQSDARRQTVLSKRLLRTRRVRYPQSSRTPTATSTKCSRLSKAARSLAKATR